MSGEPATPYITDEAQILHDIREEVMAIRDSQENVERIVKGIVEAMKSNPMLASMGLRLP